MVIYDLTQADLAFLNRSGVNRTSWPRSTSKATQLEQWVDRVPVKVRNAIALNPAKLVENSDNYIKISSLSQRYAPTSVAC